MKKAGVLLVIALLLFLCACGGNNAGNNSSPQEYQSSTPSHKPTEVQNKSNPLYGSWYSDEDAAIFIFSESGTLYACAAECSNNVEPTVNMLTEQFKITSNNTFETYNTDGTVNDTYKYSISGNKLEIFFESPDYSLCFTKIKKSSPKTDPLIGQWRLLSIDYMDCNTYDHNIYDIHFYSDGTYTSKHMDTLTYEVVTKNSRYSIIHDGRTIELEHWTYLYWDYEFLSDDVMLVSADGRQLLYIAK